MPVGVRRQSSTQGVASDDEDDTSSVLVLVPSDVNLNLSQDLSNRSLCQSMGDDSMFVNTKTETESINQDFPAVAPSNSSRPMNSIFRGGGLSRSAVQLLSQDDQTLNEMLEVDVDIDIDIDDEDEVNDTELTRAAASTITTATTSGDRGRSHTRASTRSSNTNEKYILRVEELEHQLRQKEIENSSNKLAWEKKSQLQQRVWESKIHDLQKELTQIKGLDISSVNVNTDADVDAADDVNINININVADHDGPCATDDINKQLVEDARVATLSTDQIARYSRQLLLREGWGVTGQQKLLSSRVLVIGAGGIGSTLLLYLASSGVGNITVMDFDHVDMSNLHRQVIHTDEGVGMNKAISACNAMKKLNPTINCTPMTEMLTFDNAMELVKRHDCVVDACDNPRTRYLINDACILNNIPLVSGSAMGVEGQLTVYGYKDSGCYRCLYPKVNPTEGSKSCSDNGVLGPVPGLIGVLQAIEALKVLTGAENTMHDRLLMYDSLRCSFMTIKKGKKRSTCAICGPQPSIVSMDQSRAVTSSARGPQQCGTVLLGDRITSEMNKSCKNYYQLLKDDIAHVLLDVRVAQQFELCSLKGAFNIELASLEDNVAQIVELSDRGSKSIYCVCRRGIASAEATRILSEILPSHYSVFNIKGGLNAWVIDVDPSFPMY